MVHFRASVVLGVLLSIFASRAYALQEDYEDWLGPTQGDMELRGGVDFSHLFDFGLSDFSIQIAFGYFFTDWLQGGVSGSLGFSGPSAFDDIPTDLPDTPDVPDTPSVPASPLSVGALNPVLTIGALARRDGGWHGTTNLWLRFFPFGVPDEPLLPPWFAPFVEFEFGPQYGEDIKPYIVWTSWLGANLYITEQLAFGPRVGYALIYITDKDIRTDGEKLEHSLVTSLGFSLFFTP
jgi:hypothetical protein